MKKNSKQFCGKKNLLVVILTLLSNFTQTSSAGLFDEFKKGLGEVEKAITDGNELIKKTKEASAKKDNKANQNQTPINNSPITEEQASPQKITVAAANKKTTIHVNDPNLNMFRTVIEASARARMIAGYKFALQQNKYVRYDSVKYDCRLLHWRKTANPTSISDKAMNGDYKNLASANIEFIGVQPTNDQGVCAFDEANIIGKYKEVAPSTIEPVKSVHSYGSRHFDSMTVSVFKFRKSHLQTCIEKFGAERAKSACNMTIPQDTLPSIVFRISHEEMGRIGLRSAANTKTGYWKAGFTPKHVESLTGSKKVKLINVNMHHDRGEVYFESITIIE